MNAFARLLRRIPSLIATGFGLGYAPVASGTFGALLGCLIVWTMTERGLSLPLQIAQRQVDGAGRGAELEGEFAHRGQWTSLPATLADSFLDEVPHAVNSTDSTDARGVPRKGAGRSRAAR